MLSIIRHGDALSLLFPEYNTYCFLFFFPMGLVTVRTTILDSV